MMNAIVSPMKWMSAACSLVAGLTGTVFAASPVFTPVCGTTVYVKEPVRLQLNATDADGGTLTYAVTGLPAGASVNASTGLLTWQPALTDAGIHTATFSVSDGNSTTTMPVIMTVVMPSLPANGGFKLLRPNGGEVFRFGDSITIAWVMPMCSYLTNLQIHRKPVASINKTCWLTPDDGIKPAIDSNGARRGFCYTFQDRGLVIGFYRQLLDDVSITGCAHAVKMGGDSLTSDSLYIDAYNQYGTEQGSNCTDPALQTNLVTGDRNDGPFSVVPRAAWQPGCSASAGMRSVRPAFASRQAIGRIGVYSLSGARFEASSGAASVRVSAGAYVVRWNEDGRTVTKTIMMTGSGILPSLGAAR